jgi:hypothetical protein
MDASRSQAVKLAACIVNDADLMAPSRVLFTYIDHPWEVFSSAFSDSDSDRFYQGIDDICMRNADADEHDVERGRDLSGDSLEHRSGEVTDEQPHPMITFSRTLSLREYRVISPNIAEVPTLTQMGFIDVILKRVRRKAVQRARRRERFQRVCRLLLDAFTPRRRADSVPLLPSVETAPTAMVKPASRVGISSTPRGANANGLELEFDAEGQVACQLIPAVRC